MGGSNFVSQWGQNICNYQKAKFFWPLVFVGHTSIKFTYENLLCAFVNLPNDSPAY